MSPQNDEATFTTTGMSSVLAKDGSRIFGGVADGHVSMSSFWE